MAYKEGMQWISKRTNQMRFTSNGEDRWLQPLSNYIAGEAIKRGQPVSVAIAADIAELGLSGDPDNVVVLTRTSRHVKAIGIALEPVAAGALVHIQNIGRLSYRSTVPATEYWPGFLNGDRGKAVYIGTAPGTLTLDRTVAITGGHNLIQLGSISNATDTTFDLEVEIAGDGRGPLDNTQFEYNIGEDVWYRPGMRAPLFAIGNDAAAPFFYNFKVNRPTTPWPTDNKWLAIYSAQTAIILIFGSNTIPAYSSLADGTRLSFIQNSAETVVKLNVVDPGTWGQPWVDDTDLYNAGVVRFVNSLAQSILPHQYLLAPGSTLSATYSPTVNGVNIQTDVLMQIQGNVNGGPIYVEWDSALDPLFQNSAYMNQGSYGQAGTAILADKRFMNRANVLGFLLNEPSDTDPYTPVQGDVGLFLRKGLIRFTGAANALIPGARYFLDVNGQITPNPGSVVYPEVLVEIGTARNTTDLMVDISQPLLGQIDYPVAAIKPSLFISGQAVAEDGWLLCDGVTSHPQMSFPELYDALVGIYGIASVRDPGNLDNFIIPLQVQISTGRPYQIKAYQVLPGYQPLTTLVNVIRGSGAGTTTITLDVTAFASVGPQGGGEIPTIETLIPMLYVDMGTDDWRAVPAASWKVDDTNSKYTLIGDLTGTPAANKPYKLAVYKPESLARFNEPSTALSVMNVLSPLAVNSKAVDDYVKTSVTTQSLTVTGSVQFGDMAGIDQLRVNGPIIINAGNTDDRLSTLPTLGNSLTMNLPIVGPLDPVDNKYPVIGFEAGIIHSVAAMSPLTAENGVPAALQKTNIATADTLVTRQFVDDHRNEKIVAKTASSSGLPGTSPNPYPVHGIQQSVGGNFDADRLDLREVGGFGWTISGTSVNADGSSDVVANADNTLNTIPEIRTADGGMELGKYVDLFNAVPTGDKTPHAQSMVGTRVGLGGSTPATAFPYINSPNANIQALQIGSSDVGAICNFVVTSSALEVTKDVTPIAGSGQFLNVKAAGFQTVSTVKAKQNIQPFARSALDIVKNTGIYEYELINDPSRRRAGFLAEYTDALMSGPNQNEMDLGTTVGIALKAIQELAADNDRLRKQIRSMQRARKKRS